MTRRLIMAAAVLALCAGARGDEWSQMIGQTDQVTRGLVAYWSMRNSGTTVFDEWGGNNGGGSNGVAFGYSSGVVGNGASFDGTNDYISTSNHADLKPVSAISISAWVKPSSVLHATSEYPTIVADYAGADSSTTGLKWILRQKDAKAQFWTNSGTLNALEVSGFFVLNEWVHVVATYENGSGRKIYKNGALVSGADSYSGNLITTENVIMIGRGNTKVAVPEYWKGLIDEVRIYNVALTADEIKQLYRMGALPRGLK